MRSLIIVALLGLFATAANAETTAWKWTTEDGVVSFTDEKKYVPKAYRDSAEQVTLGALADYKQFTPVTAVPEVEEAPAEAPVATTINNTTINTTPAPDCDRVPGPVRLTREMRWLDGVGGAPGKRYVAVDVLYDADGNELASALADQGAIFLNGDSFAPRNRR